MPTSKCRHCPKSFTKDTTTKALQARNMHERRKHVGNLMPRREARMKLESLNSNGHAETTVLTVQRDEATTTTDRRSKEWLRSHPEELARRIKNYLKSRKQNGVPRTSKAKVAPARAEVQIVCCPLCGCHIDDVAKGIAQGKMERGEL